MLCCVCVSGWGVCVCVCAVILLLSVNCNALLCCLSSETCPLEGKPLKVLQAASGWSPSGICWQSPACAVWYLDTLTEIEHMTWCLCILSLMGKRMFIVSATRTFNSWSKLIELNLNSSSSCPFVLTPSPSVSHNDLALQLRILHNNRLSQIDLHNVNKVATDITRLQEGRVQALVL